MKFNVDEHCLPYTITGVFHQYNSKNYEGESWENFQFLNYLFYKGRLATRIGKNDYIMLYYG